MEISFRNKSQSKNKVPFIIFKLNERLELFKGIAIPGIISVIDRHYYSPKDAIFTFKLNKGVSAHTGNKLVYGDTSYCIQFDNSERIVHDINDVMNSLQVTEGTAKAFVAKSWDIGL